MTYFFYFRFGLQDLTDEILSHDSVRLLTGAFYMFLGSKTSIDKIIIYVFGVHTFVSFFTRASNQAFLTRTFSRKTSYARKLVMRLKVFSRDMCRTVAELEVTTQVVNLLLLSLSSTSPINSPAGRTYISSPFDCLCFAFSRAR